MTRYALSRLATFCSAASCLLLIPNREAGRDACAPIVDLRLILPGEADTIELRVHRQQPHAKMCSGWTTRSDVTPFFEFSATRLGCARWRREGKPREHL